MPKLRHDSRWDSKPGSHDCEPSILPLSSRAPHNLFICGRCYSIWGKCNCQYRHKNTSMLSTQGGAQIKTGPEMDLRVNVNVSDQCGVKVSRFLGWLV